ncbi:hypothetical protein [Paraburkholderia sp. RAU2J]|uniref:hypothetical protein n=1 Tax=Paraburkholderia sp. RAU2J TaxID=1938810 RepID=UPI0011C430EC|nr:hypothetical protein [Paraburkholderia sp. RAU2J]
MRTPGGWKLARAPLEGLKRKRPVALFAAHGKSRDGETTDEPSCIKTVRISMERAARHDENETLMKVNCSWNDAHDSTMTDDRANLLAEGCLARALDPLTGGRLRRIRVVREHTLKTAGNEPFGSFSGWRPREKSARRSVTAAGDHGANPAPKRWQHAAMKP